MCRFKNAESIETTKEIFGLGVGEILSRGSASEPFVLYSETVGGEYTKVSRVSLSEAFVDEASFKVVSSFDSGKEPRRSRSFYKKENAQLKKKVAHLESRLETRLESHDENETIKLYQEAVAKLVTEIDRLNNLAVANDSVNSIKSLIRKKHSDYSKRYDDLRKLLSNRDYATQDDEYINEEMTVLENLMTFARNIFNANEHVRKDGRGE